MSILSYARLTARAERTIRSLLPNSQNEARGAIALWEDLVTEMDAFQRGGYEADHARLWALIDPASAKSNQS